jgi:DNA polymerase III epsilon subunit-like protein
VNVPYLIIDTETNGLMDYKRPADAPGQPRVAEFAGILVTDNGDVELEFQRYIKPPMTDGGPAWVMTEEATKKNNITNEMLWNQGVPINEVLNWYQAHIIAGRTVVAFGAQYDCKMMRSELRRADRDDLFEHTPNICLMRECRAWAKSIGRDIIKAGGSQKGWPKLTDLATFCGVPFNEADLHGALADARIKAACFNYMLDNGFEAVGRVHHAKDYDAIKNAS